MIHTTKNLELFDKKGINYFWQSLDAILEEVTVAKTIIWCSTINKKTSIFQCFKNYISPTHVTRLKVAVSMADPISIMENSSYP